MTHFHCPQVNITFDEKEKKTEAKKEVPIWITESTVDDRDDDSNSASATSLAAAAIGPAPSLAAEEAGGEPDDEITNILLRHERINK